MTLSAINDQGCAAAVAWGIMTLPSIPRGRPARITPEHIADSAVTLFEERGYDAVSMDTVATHAGISRRSLFRYFPTKGDLVWSGVGPVREHLHARLATIPAGQFRLAELGEAIIDSILSLDFGSGVTRTRLRIIADHPDLLAAGPGKLEDFWGELEKFLGEHLPGNERATARAVLVDALSSVVFGALVRWARGQNATPERDLRAALSALRGLDAL